MTNTQLLQYWFDQVWTNGNLDVIDQMFRSDTVASGLLPSFDLKAVEFRDLVVAIRNLLTDIKVTFSHTLEQADWLAVRTIINAKRADTGAEVQVTGQVFVRFQDQCIAETHSQFDFYSLFEQLGQLPPDALPICLTGQALQWK